MKNIRRCGLEYFLHWGFFSSGTCSKLGFFGNSWGDSSKEMSRETGMIDFIDCRRERRGLSQVTNHSVGPESAAP